MHQLSRILDKYTSNEVHGMVHCSGGAQTKILHFVEFAHYKDNLFPVPPLFQLIQEQSKQIGKRCIRFSTAVIAWIVRSQAVAQDIIAISNPLTLMLK
jgi:phosphoribosylformylglycinamidine cyclo-ligase